MTQVQQGRPTIRPQPRSDILVVDDEPESLRELETMLSPLGRRVVCARSGIEALRHLADADVAVALIDIDMPHLGGFETTKLIRSQRRTRHLPIVFLGAATDADQITRAQQLGVIEFVFKPLVALTVRSKIERFMERRRNAGPEVGHVKDVPNERANGPVPLARIRLKERR